MRAMIIRDIDFTLRFLGGAQMRLLIVEDEKKLNSILEERFVKSGYCVDKCYDGENALFYIGNTEYDGIILDIMMPKLDGLTVLRTIRAQKIMTPVLLLTAKDTEEDVVKGLDLGANDYLIKPFSFEILSARVRAMLRTDSRIGSDTIELADLSMDCRKRIVKRNNKIIELSAKEYSILEYLMRNQGIIMSKDKIEQHIWNYEYEGGSDVIKVYIHHLRKKIDGNSDVKLLHTVKNMGYVLKEKA